MKKEMTILELSNSINTRFDAIDKRFDRVETKLEDLQTETCKEFNVVTDLLHSVSKVAQRTEEAVKRLTPTTSDHEKRISALERSNIRLRLLVDR